MNGYKHGYGTWKSKISFKYCVDSEGEYYVGDWRENKANGKGEHVWANGDKYIGEWLDFLKHGYGTDYFANGD